jgi:hypothetical protein
MEEAVRMTGRRLTKAELQRLSADELIAFIEAGGDWFDGVGSNPPHEPRPAALPTSRISPCRSPAFACR